MIDTEFLQIIVPDCKYIATTKDWKKKIKKIIIITKGDITER